MKIDPLPVAMTIDERVEGLPVFPFERYGQIVVRLDGVVQRRVVAYDTEQGFIVAHMPECPKGAEYWPLERKEGVVTVERCYEK